jgi:hypothetical protein
MSDKPKKQITPEELAKIFELIQQAYAEGGKKLETATLFDEENPDGKIVVDNREEEDLN